MQMHNKIDGLKDFFLVGWKIGFEGPAKKLAQTNRNNNYIVG
jgi:hypothetical protein